MTYTVVTTPANVYKVAQTHSLLYSEEWRVHGDTGYVGAEKRTKNLATSVSWYFVMRPGTRRVLRDTP